MWRGLCVWIVLVCSGDREKGGERKGNREKRIRKCMYLNTESIVFLLQMFLSPPFIAQKEKQLRFSFFKILNQKK